MVETHGSTSGFGWPIGVVFSIALILLPSRGQHCNMSNVTTLPQVLAEDTEWYNSSAIETKVLHIGTALTLDRSTRYGYFGQHLKQAYTMYFDWLNKNSGGLTVAGEKYWVKLHLLDDKSDGDTVENITRHLAHDKKIKHFLGPYGSALTTRATKVLNDESDAVMVCGSAASTSVFLNRSRMFGLLSTSGSFLEHVFDTLHFSGAETVGYMYEDLAFTRGVCSQVPYLASSQSMRVVFGANGFGGFTEDGTGTAAKEMVVNMSRVNPDVLIGCVYANACNHILNKAVEINFNPKAIVLTVCVTTQGFRIANGDNAGYVLGVAPWTREVTSTSKLTGMRNQDFVKQYEHLFGGRTPYQAAAAFSSAATLSHAIQQAGTVNDPGKVADELRKMDTLSTFGQIAFDGNGQGKNPIKVVQVVGNMTPVIAPPLFSTQSLFYPKPTFNAMLCKNSDPFNVGRHGIIPNGSCLPCDITEIAPYNTTLTFRQCKKLICPPGHMSRIYPASNLTLGGALCMKCGPGYFASYYGSTQCDTCSVGTYQNQRGQTACLACSVGKHTSARNSIVCTNCNGGRFSSTQGASRCLSCPKGSFCVANAQGFIANYSNDDGWYKWNENGAGLPVLIRCRHGEDGNACVRNGLCHVDPDTNEVAMEGPFCGKCRQGYGREQVHSLCTQCPSVFVSVLLVLFQGFKLIAFSFIVYMAVLWMDLTKPKNISQVIIKQMLNYFGMTTVVFEVTDFRFPILNGFIVDCMNVLRFIFGTTSPLFVAHAADCLMSRFSAPYKMYIAMALAWVPMWAILLTCLFWLVWFYYRSRGLKPPRRSRLITLLVVNLFIVHPRNTEFCLSVFRCKHFDKPRLMSDTSLDCQDSSLTVWQILGGLSFVMYSLGIPFGTFLVLRHYKKLGKLTKRKTVNTLGFLYSGFEPQCYYFETVFMLRKVLFQLIILIPPLAAQREEDDKTIKCMSMLLLACFFLAVHMACEPYDNRAYFALDRIEGAMLWAILLTLLTQAWIFVSDQAHVFNATNNGDPEQKKSNRDIRDILGAVFVFLCHARFFWLVIMITLRPIFADITRWAIFDHGFVEIRNDGFRLFKADGIGRKLFTTMFQELADLLLEARSSVCYEEMVTCLQYMAVNCLYHRKKERFHRGVDLDDKTDDHLHDSVWDSLEREKLRMIFQRAKHTFIRLYMNIKHAGDAAASRAASMGHAISRRNIRMSITGKAEIQNESISSPDATFASNFFHSESPRSSRDLQTVSSGDIPTVPAVASKPSRPSMFHLKDMKELERLKHFNADTLARCFGECFSIQELHMAMVRLSKDIGSIQLGDPNGVDNMDHRRGQEGRVSFDSITPTEDDDDVSNADADDQGREIRELEAELQEVQTELRNIQELHEQALQQHELDLKESQTNHENVVADMKNSLAQKAKRDLNRDCEPTNDPSPSVRTSQWAELGIDTFVEHHEELAADPFRSEASEPNSNHNGRISQEVLLALSSIAKVTATEDVCTTCHNHFQDDSKFCRICGEKRPDYEDSISDESDGDDEELVELRSSLRTGQAYQKRLEDTIWRMKLDLDETTNVNQGQDVKLRHSKQSIDTLEEALGIQLYISGSYMDKLDHAFDVVQEGSLVEFGYRGAVKTGTLKARMLHVHDKSWPKGYVLPDGDIAFEDGVYWTKQFKFESNFVDSASWANQKDTHVGLSHSDRGPRDQLDLGVMSENIRI